MSLNAKWIFAYTFNEDILMKFLRELFLFESNVTRFPRVVNVVSAIPNSSKLGQC